MALRATCRRLAPKVVVGLSGGVDSSVAALLLLRQGYEVEGVHMTNWDDGDETAREACPQTQDYKDALEVSTQLGIRLHRADFIKPYWTHVFTPFLEEYEKGMTPNPDVLCNREIKFNRFIDFASDLGAHFVATGHYARLQRHTHECAESALGGVGHTHTSSSSAAAATAAAAASPSSSSSLPPPSLLSPPPPPPSSTPTPPPRLLMGVDSSKDQSYFLSHVPLEAFRRVLFPLGGLFKSQVRQLAREAGLCTAERRESMGICFIGKRRLGSFLPSYLEPRPGVFVSVEDERVLGSHNGAALYTPGQGAKIGGVDHKWFVCGKDMDAGVVYVAPGTSHPALYTDWLEVPCRAFNWLIPPPQFPFRCNYRVRYRQALAECVIHTSEDTKDMLIAEFEHPQRAVAPGQTLALYDGDVCMGGGVIGRPGPSYFEMGKVLPEEVVDWAVS